MSGQVKGEKIYRGIPVSAGVCRGKVLLLHQARHVIARRELPAAGIEAEVKRFEQSLVRTRQQITEVVRGADLFEATFLHRLLQALLGLPTPAYHHHRLIRDESGKRLAKRDDARALAHYRAEGATPQDIRRIVGLPCLSFRS